MSDLLNTNLVITAAPLPADFEGTPQDWADALVERMKIQSPVGTNFFQTGDQEPATDQGPWLKGGTAWYVFSKDEGKYVPLDITASTTPLVTVAILEPPAPTATDPSIWLRVTAGRVIDLYYWNGTVWRPGGKVSASGTTAERPTGAVDFEQFFDTDINALVHWERGAWRTVSGVPGDVKFVTTPLLADALASNPGWDYLGASNQAYIGRSLGIASTDTGATPAASFVTASGTTPRAAGDMAGSETHTLTSTEIEQHTHLVGQLKALNSNNNFQFYRVNDTDNFKAPPNAPPNYAELIGDGNPNGTKMGNLPDLGAGVMIVTSKQLSTTTAPDFTGAATPHDNLSPTLYLWALTKG